MSGGAKLQVKLNDVSHINAGNVLLTVNAGKCTPLGSDGASAVPVVTVQVNPSVWTTDNFLQYEELRPDGLSWSCRSCRSFWANSDPRTAAKVYLSSIGQRYLQLTAYPLKPASRLIKSLLNIF